MNIFKPPRSRHLSGKILLSLLWFFPIAVSLEPARSQEQGVTTIPANPEENALPPTVASPSENVGTDDLGTPDLGTPDLGTPDPVEAGSVPIPSPPTEAATEVAQDAPDATTSLQVLFPQPAADGTLVLDRPSTNLVVEFTGDEPPEVLLNGKPLDEEILSQIERGEATSWQPGTKCRCGWEKTN
ncbi:MAG: hypothetical protein HC925_05395 [Coleofasciculaceae cyanobacterium SM2_3_26]|nr:hypothetical protein [Coleofasciculaceae cyanobacterium SM2_3_26]